MRNTTGPLKLTIRTVKVSDLNAIYDIEERSFPYPWPMAAFKLFCWRNPNGFFVATAKGKVIGYVIVEISGRLESWIAEASRGVHLLNIAVNPDFRRRGVGKALMEAITVYARKEGARTIWLEVRASNSTAISFYHCVGFEEMGFKQRYYLNEDAVMMTKEI